MTSENRKRAEEAAEELHDHRLMPPSLIYRNQGIIERALQAAADAARREAEHKAIRWAWREFYTGNFMTIYAHIIDLDHAEAMAAPDLAPTPSHATEER